jgi:hypothetical protein
LHDVRDEIAWQTMLHKGGEVWNHAKNIRTLMPAQVPRLICIQGTIQDGWEPVYRHPADEQPILVPWTPTVARIRVCGYSDYVVRSSSLMDSVGSGPRSPTKCAWRTR